MVIARIRCTCGKTITMRLHTGAHSISKTCWGRKHRGSGATVTLTQVGRDQPHGYVNGREVHFPDFKIDLEEYD